MISSMAFLILLCHLPSELEADWPTYAADIRRSNETEQALKLPLKAAWRFTSAQAPAPAWPEPVKNLNRLDFDYAPQPVIAEGLVCFGSSSDDAVRALDLKTGEERWHFITGGPVRFAPQIYEGKAYFGSDDGWVYCVDAGTGELVWKFNAAPIDERFLGNGRMISRWPIRTSVLVDKGIVYFAAGMWAAEGVYVYALGAKNGAVIWCNDTSGTIGLMVAHATFSLTGVNPQGYLLATDDTLLVPTGRTAPAAYDRKTGKLLHHDPGHKNNGFGGTWLTIRGDRFFAFSKNFYSSLGVRAASVKTGKFFDARHSVPQHSVFYREKQYSLYDGKTCVVIGNQRAYSMKAFGLIKSGDRLVIGQDGYVEITRHDKERTLWRGDVKGKARGFAVGGGRLIVTTDSGEISCFATDKSVAGEASIHRQKPEQEIRPDASYGGVMSALKSAGIHQGYALLLGDGDAGLARTLAAATALHCIVVLHDESKVAKLRNELLVTSSIYGSRIHVHFVKANGRLPFAQYFANAIIVQGRPNIEADELYRLLRPRGGTLLLTDQGKDDPSYLKTSKVPADEIKHGDQPVRVVRGKLPGALDWDSEKPVENRVKWPLRPIWFGGPGPARMLSRKYRNQTLAFADGRYFVMGEGHLIAVDAYNGLELWSKTIPRLRSLNADATNVYLLTPSGDDGKGTTAIILDPASGREKERTEILDEIPERFRKWTRPGVDASITRAARAHPLTGTRMQKAWMKAFGCSGYTTSGASLFTRSGALGIYDFEDDSGMRNFGGLRPACGYSTIAAMGLWIVNEGSSSCECSYSYQTSLAFAPAERRLQEDWALFYDWQADSLVRQAALNLGAPGDRRDEKGSLWLGYPRPPTTEMLMPKTPGGNSWMNIPGVPQQKMPLAMVVPLKLEGAGGQAIGSTLRGGAFRLNAERVPIAGTDKPWIYASCVRGIRKAILELDFMPQIVFESTANPPNLDGRLEEGEWGEPQSNLPDSKTKVFLRYDRTNIYIASFRPPVINRLGKYGWNKKMTRRDSDVYREDSWEIFISDARSKRVVHLGISAGGALFDALATEKRNGDKRWNGNWTSKVSADEKGFVTESAIPLSALSGAGLDPATLSINFQINRRHNIGEALMVLGYHGRPRCENFAPAGFDEPPERGSRSFTVSLHFAELEDLPVGARVFSVKLQDEVVLKDLDIRKEAGGTRKAFTRTFTGVRASKSLRLEFLPTAGSLRAGAEPQLNGLEVYDEGFMSRHEDR